MKRGHTYLPVLILAILLAACAAPAEPTATPDLADELPQPTETQPTATDEPMQLSAQPYVAQFEAYRINFPQGWNCSESGTFQADCQSPDGAAGIGLRATGTGYELYQADFEALVHAEQVYQYGSVKAYTELERTVDEGVLIESATWRESGVDWQSEDRFSRDGAGVFQLHFRAHPDQWDAYAALFESAAASAAFQPQNLTYQQMYTSRREYDSPAKLFKLDVPTGWTRYVDTAKLRGAVVEGFLSPDGRASLQVVEYTQDSLIDTDRKAFKALDLMRDLYGFEWRVSDDRQLPNDLEQLTWYASRFDLYGITYFDSYRNVLYMFNIVWDLETEPLYRPLLEDLVDGFRYE